MSSFKLTYFNARGLAEMSRLLLVDSDTKFEDERIEHADWKELKSKTPFGKLPILKVDDKWEVANSRSIVRYLARVLNYEGGSPQNAAIQDVWIENLSEASAKLSVDIEDPALKKQKLAEVMKVDVKPKLSKFEEDLGKSCGTYLFGGDKPAAVDFFIFCLTTSLRDWELLGKDEFPSIVKLEKEIADRPSIKAWIKKRPKTDF